MTRPQKYYPRIRKTPKKRRNLSAKQLEQFRQRTLKMMFHKEYAEMFK